MDSIAFSINTWIFYVNCVIQIAFWLSWLIRTSKDSGSKPDNCPKLFRWIFDQHNTKINTWFFVTFDWICERYYNVTCINMTCVFDYMEMCHRKVEVALRKAILRQIFFVKLPWLSQPVGTIRKRKIKEQKDNGEGKRTKLTRSENHWHPNDLSSRWQWLQSTWWQKKVQRGSTFLLDNQRLSSNRSR